MKGLGSATKRRVRESSTGSVTSFTTSHENVRQSRAYPDDDDRDVDSLGICALGYLFFVFHKQSINMATVTHLNFVLGW